MNRRREWKRAREDTERRINQSMKTIKKTNGGCTFETDQIGIFIIPNRKGRNQQLHFVPLM